MASGNSFHAAEVPQNRKTLFLKVVFVSPKIRLLTFELNSVKID